MGGSSKKVTVGYRYFLGVHMILCHGPVDKLIRILVDKRSAWSGGSTGGQISINAQNLFGGESREGGISGAVDVEMGGPSQGQNSYLLSKIGNDIPSFRGVMGVVLRQVYVGINPYLKPWAFRVQRIHKRQSGIAQWYDAKAEIKSNEYLQVENEVLYDSIYLAADVYNGPPSADGRFLPISGLNASGILKIEVLDGAWSRWASDTSNGGRAWTCGFHLTKEDGSSVGFYDDDSYSSAHYFPTASQAESYVAAQSPATITGSASYKLHFADWVLNENRGGLTFRISYSGLLAIGDMNPAHIIRECLTDPDWGMGYQESDIDDASFIAAADKMYEEGMGISLLWDKQTPLEDFIKEIIRHISAALYVDRKSGKFVLKLIREDYVKADLLVLGEGEIQRVQDYSRPSFGELVNSVTANFWNSATSMTSSITVDDPALIQMQGAVIGTTIQYPGFSNGKIAAKCAMSALRTLSTPMLTCTIYANKAAADLNIGDPFLFEWPDYHEGQIVMRVTGLGLGDGKSNTIRITCAQDTFDLPATTIVTPEVPDWTDPTSEPIPAQYRAVVEAPYYELVQRLGQTTTDNQLGSNVNLGYILASAAAPSGAINGRLAIDAGAGYDGNDTAMDFCPAAFLAADITPGQTSISITGGQSLSAVTTGTHAQIGNELVKVTALTDTTLTAGRGVLDTVPAAHASGTPVLFWDAYADSDDVEYVAGESLNVKILPTTGKGTLDVADAPVDNLTFVSRAYRPYAPGNLKINGSAYPDTIGSDSNLSLSWSHRDRLQQTAGDIVDTTAGSIGPELGTTYTIKLYSETGTLLRTESGLTNTSYEYTQELSDGGAAYDEPLWSSTVLLLNGNGVNGSTTFTDETGKTQSSVGGNAQISTVQSKYGGASMAFDGSGDYFTFPDSNDWDFGTGDFTVELWARFTSSSSIMTLICNYLNSSTGWSLQRRSDNNNLVFGNGDTHILAKAWTPTSGVWYHIAICRQGTNLRAFIDGVQLGTTVTNSSNITGSTNPLVVGSLYLSSYIQNFNGYLDDIRITKAARYTSNFTPPASQLSRYIYEARRNGKLRFTLESMRDGYSSYQAHDYTVRRLGYGFNYGESYGGA